MFVYIIGNLPLPLIAALNVVVFRKQWLVRRYGKRKHIIKPERLVIGNWLNLLSVPFAWAPALIEGRFFVQNPLWIYSYGVAAALSIVGLLCLNSGLSRELVFMRTPARTSR